MFYICEMILLLFLLLFLLFFRRRQYTAPRHCVRPRLRGVTPHHLTEPSIPSTKLFCMMKKIAAVGKVAVTMATMIIPKSGV